MAVSLLWVAPVAAIADSAQDHRIVGDQDDVVVPRGTAVTSGSEVIVPGQTPAPELNESDATLVARSGLDGTESWRIVLGRPDTLEYFAAVAIRTKFVCAAGVGLNAEPFAREQRLLVACAHRRTGRVLWSRDFPLAISGDPKLEMNKGLVVVTVPVFNERRSREVFAFRLLDGS